MRVLTTDSTRISGLSVIRGLAAEGHEAMGADDRSSPFGLRSRHVATPGYLLPRRRSPEFLPALITLLRELRPDVFIPGACIAAAVQARSEILALSRSLLPEPEAFRAVHDKEELLKRCAALRIPTPERFTFDEGMLFLRERCPGQRLVVKPRLDFGGGEGVHFIREPGELERLYPELSQRHGGVVVTEYVPGPVHHLVAAHLLFDEESRLIGSFLLRKYRIWPAEVGVTVAAVSVHEPELVEQLMPLFEEVGWRGPAEAELKIDERDGRAKVLEINPRFSGAVHFPISCGVNLPGLLVRAAMGERLPLASLDSYRAGTRYLSTGRWSRAVLTELREAEGRRREVLARAFAERGRPRVSSEYTLTDPGPLLAKLLHPLQRDRSQAMDA